MELSASILVLSATMCWGLAQVIGKLALKNMSTILFNSIRLSVTAPIVILAVFSTGGLGELSSWPVAMAVLSSLFGLFFATHLFFYSIKREAANRVIPAGNTYPFWVIALAPIFLGEELRLILPVSAALVFAGISLLVPGKKEPSLWKAGVPLASLAAFLWGVGSILDKYCLNSGMAVATLVLIKMFVAAVLFDAVAGIAGQMRGINTNSKSVYLTIVSGILAFPIGTFLFSAALKIEQAGTLAPISGTTIFFGFLFSILLLGEKPTKRSLLGTVLVLAGVLLTT